MILDLVQFRTSEKLIDVGQIVIGPLAAPRLNYPVEVTVEYKEDGTVRMLAYDAETGLELSQTFVRDEADSVGRLASQRQMVRSVLINSM